MDVLGATLNRDWAEYMFYLCELVVRKVPDTLSNEAFCYVEPLAKAIHGLKRSNIQFDDVVVVAGAGPIGMEML
ncbi:MAG: hypothetical protein P8M25_04640 [Paracoccaceae bacterium]|nr:hypothetical protein [Paracoccaceae bacterium]